MKRFLNEQQNHGRMLISCPDQKGIVAAVSNFLYENGANIVSSDQHSTDPNHGHFFMRIAFEKEHLTNELRSLKENFQEIAEQFKMNWRITESAQKKRMAIFVTKEDHCLQELLWRWQIGELHADIKMVISNHPDLESVVTTFGLPFYHVPVTKETRHEAEKKHLEIMSNEIDTIILARYMQIISERVIKHFQNEMINIHHSFLPAFVGGNPYQQAYDRGVKIIGATAHYVTEHLDQGPIIEQDIQHVDHRHQVDDLKRIGRDVERIVLARAVRAHCQDRVIIDGNKTIVFS